MPVSASQLSSTMSSIARKAPDSRILWIDDYVESFAPQQDALRDQGIDVDIAKALPSEDEPLPPHDNFIVDNKFGEVGLSDGYRFVERLKKSGRGNFRAVLYSAYLSDDDVERRIEVDAQSQTAVLYLPKKMTKRADRAARNRAFADCVREFFNVDFQKIKALDLSAVFSAPTNEKVQDFQTFSSLERDRQVTVLQELSTEYSGAADEAFARGATWVLFLSGDGSAHSSSLAGAKLPSPEEVQSIGEYRNRVPILFELGLPIDDVRCVSDQALGDLSTYPLAAVYFDKKTTQSDPTDIHFDTGSDRNFLSDRFVNEIGLADFVPSGERVVTISGHKYFCELITWDVSLLAEETPDRKVFHGTLKGFSVTDWSEKPLMLRCSSQCSKTEKRGEMCVHRRNGLLGRPLLFDFNCDAIVRRGGGRIGLFRETGRKK